MEKLVKNEVMRFMDENKLITKHQHGFVKGRCCTTNLLESLDFISYQLSQNNPVDVILLDFAKAFDTVPHKRLLIKLKSYGVEGFALKWIEAFLNQRRQRVINGDKSSNWREIYSGVPQGSVISAFLFVIYINDLPNNVNNNIKLYADDTKLMGKISNLNDSTYIQEDLNQLVNWSQKWLIKFNYNKCMVMHYGNKNPHNEYTMAGNKLKKSNVERDLGVIFSTDLKWKNQIINCTSTANKTLGYIKRSFVNLDVKSTRTLYTAFIRPLIEFAGSIWSPSLKSDIHALEKIQHRATKLVPSISKKSYEERLKIFNLTTLEKRRIRGDLIQIFKIKLGLEKVDLINEFSYRSNINTRGNIYKYERELSKFDARHNFLLNRSANVWNTLPNEIVQTTNLNTFKNLLDNFNY